jgi:signal transduction histidine kinase
MVEARARSFVRSLEARSDLFDLAAALGAVLVACVAWHDHGDRPFDAVLLVAAVVPFVVCALSPHRRPTLLAATIVPVFVLGLTGGSILLTLLSAIALVRLVAASDTREGLVAAGIFAIALFGVALARHEFDWIFAAIGTACIWGAGVSIGRLDARLRQLRSAQAAVADKAVQAERRRLARELHDLVAHALTGTMLSLAEIRLVLDTDREALMRALDDAERLARASLSDLRGTVRLLSEEGDPRLEPPIELNADLARLIDGFRRSGVTVEFTSSGEPLVLSVASAWSVYRIAQESLTNAARHAPGAPITLTLTWGRDGVRVVCANERARTAPKGSDGSGRGLLGMSERAALVGGLFEAGPTSSGWAVTAFIPASPRAAVNLP